MIDLNFQYTLSERRSLDDRLFRWKQRYAKDFSICQERLKQLQSTITTIKTVFEKYVTILVENGIVARGEQAGTRYFGLNDANQEVLSLPALLIHRWGTIELDILADGRLLWRIGRREDSARNQLMWETTLPFEPSIEMDALELLVNDAIEHIFSSSR